MLLSEGMFNLSRRFVVCEFINTEKNNRMSDQNQIKPKYWKLQNIGLKSIGIIIFIVIIIMIDISEAFNLIKSVRKDYIIAAAFLSFVHLFFQALCWRSLIQIKNSSIWKFIKNFKIFIIGQYFGIVTPGKLGDVVRVFYMKRDLNLKIFEGLVNIFIHRIINILSLIFIVIVTSYTYLENHIHYSIVIIASLAIVITLYLLSGSASVRTSLKALIEKILGFIMPGRFKHYSATITQELTVFRKAKLVYPSILSVIVYLFMALQSYFILLAMDINISYISLLFFVSIGILSGILPITISGLGIRELIYIFFFEKIGYGPEVAWSFSMINIAVNYAIISIMGIIFQNKDPIPIINESKN
ncbi:lysylphosphatidylglycerol synthase transmembrane domain-containing protein [candidate division KSB1 bacterium]